LGLNFVKEIREERLISKAELARKAGISWLTIARIEKGESCRTDTMRKIILLLDLNSPTRKESFLRIK
jgi:DNA-binding XRE family transcriptional regulator